MRIILSMNICQMCIVKYQNLMLLLCTVIYEFSLQPIQSIPLNQILSASVSREV